MKILNRFRNLPSSADDPWENQPNYFGTVKSEVIDLLTTEPETRDNDNLLIARMIERESEGNLDEMTAQQFLHNVKANAYTSFESIRRMRQRLQEKRPHLRGDVYKKRHNMAEAVSKQIGMEF